METRLHYSMQGKHLSILAKESIVTDDALELKMKGGLNTANGRLVYRGCLLKNFSLDSAKSSGDSMVLGAGVGVSSASGNNPFLTARIKQVAKIGVLSNTQATLRINADVHTFQPQKSGVTAALRICNRQMKFTEKQDLELKAGLDVNVTTNPKADVYLQVRENNWTVRLQHSKWHLYYDL